MVTKRELLLKNAALQNYAEDLRARHDRAIDALRELSNGVGRKPGFYKDGETAWDACMKNLAGQELAAIAKMPLRKPT